MTTDDMTMNGGGWIWAFLIIALIFGGGGLFGGNGNTNALQSEMTAGFNNQAVQNQLQGIALSSANNNYETAKLIADQNILTMQQNNTNLINAIQGFNTVNQNIATGFATVNQSIADLGYHLDQCCCSIKTQMLQDKYDALNTKYLEAQTNLSNAAQSQYILNALGRFVAYPPAAATAAAV